MDNSINKFTTYKRIDRFVLSLILSPKTSDLEVTCRLYYPLQTRTIAETYKLSVLQKSVNISFKSGKGYIIEGTITLHFQSRNRGTEVLIFGNVEYGIGDDLQYQEGVISRYDTVRGSLSDEDIIFPDVSDLELSQLDTERNDTPSTNESGPMSDEYHPRTDIKH